MDARATTAAPLAPVMAAAPTAAATAPPQPPGKPQRNRQRLFLILGVVIAVAAIGYGVYWLLVASHHVSTDDAYVNADVADVTPLVSGPIVSAPVTDTMPVKRGDVLVVIDPTDFKIALASAQAALGQAERKVQGYFANRDAEGAMIQARAADVDHARALIASAEADFAKSRTDLARRQALARDGAVSGDELTIAENRLHETESAVTAARAALAEAQANRLSAAGQARVAEALVAGSDVDIQPGGRRGPGQGRPGQARPRPHRDPRADRRRRRQERHRRSASASQPGAPLMTVVPIQAAYVDANFKEVPAAQACSSASRSTLTSRPLWRRGELPRHGRRPRRRHRLGLRADPGPERHRQLDQGGAAPAGAHRARPEGTGATIRCASACR